jgi:recombination protein RecR
VKHSPLVQELIDALVCLPGVGPRSAQRMTYHLLERNRAGGRRLSTALMQAMEGVTSCRQCRNFAEDELCLICRDSRRDEALLCIVSSPADVLAIEQSMAFKGRYFVLKGQLSPLDGIGPAELGLPQLDALLRAGGVRELILATGTTVEGEATAHYILDMAAELDITASRIAQGVPMGGDLEFVDGATLAQALRSRRRFNVDE